MAGRVAGKVALVTGAARGQGRAHALRLAQEGADVIAVDLCAAVDNVPYPAASVDDLDATTEAIRATGQRVTRHIVDTRDHDALRAAIDTGVDQLGRLDVVVANAGICIMAPWDQVSPAIFRDTIEVNLFGTWNTVIAAIPHLIEAGGGSIVMTSSVAGLKGLPFLAPYVASKHAITGLGRTLAQELARHRIRVNTLHPTGVATGMVSAASAAILQDAIAGDPRLGAIFTNLLDVELTQPEDQADAVLFLASDESRWITAHAMTVDAGNSQY